MKKLLVLALTAVFLVAAAAPASAAKTIKVRDNVFAPKKVTVNKGTTLKFRWLGDSLHNVKGAGINIGLRRSGTKRVKAKRSGTLLCTVHPGMSMKLKVRR